MATKKKPVAKKATKKSTAKKKPTTKKTATKKPTAKKTANTKKASAKPTTRRPDANLPPTVDTIDGMTNTILNIISALDYYAANLRALDRQRHNGVGLKRLGFIEAALRLSGKFPQYFPLSTT